jgi:hypothetical protein
MVVVDDAPGLTGLDGIFVTMTVTVLLHGITAAPLTRAHARRVPAA